MTAAVTDRARAWQHARQEDLCDIVRPWGHGTVLRAGRFPDYWDHNVVRVEHDPQMSVDELAAFAEEALDGLAHRRIDVDDVAVAAALRGDFEEVPYAAVEELYRAWHREDFPDVDPGGFFDQQRAAAATRDLLVLAIVEDGRPVAFAELQRADGAAEIGSVYVSPPCRRRGLGFRAVWRWMIFTRLP